MTKYIKIFKIVTRVSGQSADDRWPEARHISDLAFTVRRFPVEQKAVWRRGVFFRHRIKRAGNYQWRSGLERIFAGI